ncbi:hypothetical protein TcasGA2_TC005150 [Tribolium castaneum]|uniref:Double jelly roll-like domain-containing protein n=1 Tax=Tribolium castaneum TaxID=7070 RepID=D7ELS5_TRICA|nr:hypothetical protein TcasGA2_TC005150 [Tribolium castaneum]
MFDIEKGIEWDEGVVGYKFQSHEAYTARYENTDEIRIPLQEDLCTLPCDSLILIEGQLVKTDATTNKTVPATETKFVNNGVAFLFSEIRYEVSGVTVDTNTKPGITTTMKNLASLNQSESLKLTMSGWDLNEEATKPIDGYFQACIPLNRLLGFAEDYKNIMLNIPQELILIRSNSDVNALICATNEKARVVIDKIAWLVPHIVPGLKEEVKLTKPLKR